MNTLTYAATIDVVQVALDAIAPSLSRGDAVKDGLGSAAQSTLQSAIRETWTKIREIVERCARVGYEAVRDDISAFGTHIECVSEELGLRAQEFRSQVLQKVREAIVGIFDVLLSTMRSDFSLGGRKYVLDSIALQQKLVYSGSLEISLTSLCKFVGEGELAVTGNYKIEPVQDS